MSDRPTVAVLHPGWMGAAIAAHLRARGLDVLWHPPGRGPRTQERAHQADLRPVPDLNDLLAQADVLLSICPPAAAEQVARTVARAAVDSVFHGIYVEANAISPTRAVAIAEHLAEAGIAMIDGAIIGPPPLDGATVRVYLAGSDDHVTRVTSLFTGTAVTPVVIGRSLGSASALKMAQAQYQKASRALAAVSHALAARYGVTDHLLAEAHRNSRSPLTDPDYLPTVAARAWRWAPELLDVADTLRQANLPDDLARGAAAVLSLWTDDKDNFDLPLATLLSQLDQPHSPDALDRGGAERPIRSGGTIG